MIFLSTNGIKLKIFCLGTEQFPAQKLSTESKDDVFKFEKWDVSTQGGFRDFFN